MITLSQKSITLIKCTNSLKGTSHQTSLLKIYNLHSTTSIKEIEFLVSFNKTKTSEQRKPQAQMASLINSTKYLRKK